MVEDPRCWTRSVLCALFDIIVEDQRFCPSATVLLDLSKAYGDAEIELSEKSNELAGSNKSAEKNDTQCKNKKTNQKNNGNNLN